MAPPARLRVGFALLVSLVAAASATGGFTAHRLLSAGRAPAPEMVTVGATRAPLGETLPRPRPDFALPDLDGRIRQASEWDGKLLVVNFWATWCPPCVHEIPLFVDLQTEYSERNVQFLGVAIDEVESAREFAEEVSLNYPSLHGQKDALDLLRDFGNASGALPYTAIVSPAGQVVHTRTGEFTAEEARATLDALLAP